MKRAVAVRPVGQWDAAMSIDRVTLDSGERHRRRIMLTGDHGSSFLLDLAHATVLRNGDGLVLDDGEIVEVAGKPEPLVEIFARGARDVARLAWHIGNRHTELQVVGDRLRIRRDHVLEEMIAALGAKLSPIDAVFDPEPVGGEGHDQPHERQHEHGHGHAP
jgi:urease accessory protein